jgi:hypothetical protein
VCDDRSLRPDLTSISSTPKYPAPRGREPAMVDIATRLGILEDTQLNLFQSEWQNKTAFPFPVNLQSGDELAS